jgi:hypothetical protein
VQYASLLQADELHRQADELHRLPR